MRILVPNQINIATKEKTFDSEKGLFRIKIIITIIKRKRKVFKI